MPTLTPEQTFGFGSIPLTSYFKAPKGGSQNTMFSPQARAMLQQDEAFQQEQMQMEADQLVNDLLGQAPQLTDAQINQALIQNPNIFRGRNAEAIQDYRQFRQQAATPADQKLGMYFYSKLQNDKDPRALQNFQRRMLEEGMSANDAWEAYRMDQFNEPLAQQLAEAGVPREEFDKYRTPSGTFDPVEVSRGIAQTRAAAKASSLGKKAAEPIDEEIELLKDAMEQRKKRLEATGGDLTKDAVFQDYADSLDKAYQQKRAVLRPPPKATVSTIADAAPAVAPVVKGTFRTPEERQKAVQEAEKAAPIEQAINSAWTQQKAKLGEQIRKIYGDNEEDLLLAAKAVLNGEADPEEAAIMQDEQLAGLPKSSYMEYLLRKVGRKADDVVFSEPESASWNRIGTQDVKNAELVKAWAEDVISLLGKKAAVQKGGGKGVKVTQIE